MGQALAANGFFGYDPAIGPLEISHSGPENCRIRSLNGAHGRGQGQRLRHRLLRRMVHPQYPLDRGLRRLLVFLRQVLWIGRNWLRGGSNSGSARPAAPAGEPYSEPQEFVITRGHYTKWSQELRITTPQEYPVHGTVGVFAQRQVHEIWEQYTMPGLDGNPYTTNPKALHRA